MDLIELTRRIENMIRLGTVAEVDHAGVRVRVATGGLSTDWLPWLHRRAGSTRDWDPPTVGELVVILSPSGDPAVGVVLPGINQTQASAPSGCTSECVRTYPDGARISYNHATGALSATGIQTALVQAAQSVTIDAPQSHFTGSVQVDGKLTVDQLLTYKSGLSGSGGSGGGTAISGPINHQGSFSNEGSMSSNGVVLHSHVHPGDSGGTTGAPK